MAGVELQEAKASAPPAVPAAIASNGDVPDDDAPPEAARSYFAEKSIFKKRPAVRNFDAVWQDKPLRMLKYRAGWLHTIGWIPGFPHLRNIRGTVLTDHWLWIQVFACWAWMLAIWKTGLGTILKDQKVFLLFFGTPYMAANLNLCMLCTFTLGLFVTLVLARWWMTRQEYGVARAASIELAFSICQNLRGVPTRNADGEPVHLSHAEREKIMRQNEHARKTLIRYLNFAHLLLLIEAQKSEKSDFTDSPDKRAGRIFRRILRRIPILRHFLKLEKDAAFGFGDIFVNPVSVMKKVGKEALDAVTDVQRAFTSTAAIVHGKVPEMAEVQGIMTEAELEKKEQKREAGEARDDFRYYFNAELVTEEEWQSLSCEEQHGSQKWRTLYGWISTILADAFIEGRLVLEVGPPPPPGDAAAATKFKGQKMAMYMSMQNMCKEMRDAGTRMFTMMNSQLPFTYVHLVAFIANMYTFILATYLSFSLLIGMPGSDLLVDAHINGAPDSVFHLTGHLYSHRTVGAQRDRGVMLFWLFAFMIMFVTTIVKGLLSMHSLLENPFGSHPCKFALTAMAKDHVTNTVAMLLEPAQREPTSLRFLFRRRHTLFFLAPDAPPRSGRKPAPLYVSAEETTGTQGARLVPLRNARVLEPEGDAEVDLLSPEFAGKILELELVNVPGGAAAAAAVAAAAGGGAAQEMAEWERAAAASAAKLAQDGASREVAEWEKRLGAVPTGVPPGPDGKGGPPETVWRVRAVKADKSVPEGGRVVQAAIRKWIDDKHGGAATRASGLLRAAAAAPGGG